MKISTLLLKWFVCLACLLAQPCGANPPDSSITFTDVSEEAGLSQLKNSMSYAAAAADFNQDGFPDLAISHHGAVSILKNNGDGTFINASEIIDFTEGDTHGISFIDLNNDGLPDLAISCGAERGRGQGSNQFYLNINGQHFKRIQHPDPIIADPLGRGRSITPADINNDGQIDLFISNLIQKDRPHRIAIARQNTVMQYEEIASLSGLINLESFGMKIVDLNNNGHPFYIANGNGADSGNLFTQKNNVFVDVSENIGIPKDLTLAAIPFDYDNDGDFDLLHIKREFTGPEGAGLKNDKIYFKLPYQPDTPQKFQAKTATSGTLIADIRFEGRIRNPEFLHLGSNKIPAKKLPWRGTIEDPVLQGTPAIDIAQDKGGFLWRDENLFIHYQFIGKRDRPLTTSGILSSDSFSFKELKESGMREKPHLRMNALFRNDNGHFTDIGEHAGILGNGLGYDAVSADFNNDGFQDIYIVNAGYSFEYPNPQNSLFINNGNGTFHEMAQQANAGGPHDGVGNGVIAMDYDKDGDIDLFLYNGMVTQPMEPGPFVLLRNDTQNNNKSISLSIEGVNENKRGWGVRVLSSAAGQKLYQQKYAMNGYLATNDLPIHIGVGQNKRAEKIKVIWPSGKETNLTSVKAGAQLSISR